MVLRDRRLRQGSFAWPAQNGLQGTFADFWRRSLIGQEGTRHRMLRQIAVPALSEDFITGLAPGFRALAEALVSAVPEDGHVEFMSAVALPYAGQAVCLLLDIETDRWAEIAQDAADLGLSMGVDCRSHQDRINAAHDRLVAIADKLIARVRGGALANGLIARFLDRAGSEIDDQTLRDLVVISIFGGVDTTRSQLGHTMALFAAYPSEWERMRNDPRLATKAVDEAIRTHPTTTWVTRETLEDIDVDGVAIEAGTTVHIFVHATAHEDTLGFDLKAEHKSHFGFGGGAHHCLGHLVARTDLAIALQTLARHFARVRLDGDPVVLPDSGNTGPVRQPMLLLRS